MNGPVPMLKGIYLPVAGTCIYLFVRKGHCAFTLQMKSGTSVEKNVGF